MRRMGTESDKGGDEKQRASPLSNDYPRNTFGGGGAFLNLGRDSGFDMQGMGRATFFPMHEKIDGALNIDNHNSDDSDLDLDKYEVNMDTGHKKKYKRIYE
jgi:hypothetical protein